jgi:hypothetical protein
VLREAESLRTSGYERAGNWDLARVCNHLAIVMEMSLDGFPMRPFPRLVRWAARCLFLGSILRHQVFRWQIPAPHFTLPPDTHDDWAAVERLRAALDRLLSHAGPMQPSPVFGQLSAAEWWELHLWHCEHHFSFLWPNRAATEP